jgi:choline-sulfatase
MQPGLRKPVVVATLAVFAGLLSPVAEAQAKAGSSKPKPPLSPPNIVLITVDTLRADRLGCYGSRDVQTTAMNSLARDGILYEHAITQVPLTWPSHASMLTGTYPFHNGVQDFTGQSLSPKFRNIAESLHDAGYDTGAIVSSFVLDRSWGLARGFNHYDDAFSGADFLHKDVALVERRGDETVDRAIAWLKARKAQPFFLWLHLYDPHSPYDPPEPYRSQYKDRPYDGEVAYTDHEIIRFLGFLRSSGQYERAAIILASDHGESLGEHGEKEHGFFVYNSTVHVPLILKLPRNRTEKGRRIGSVVEISSIAATILQIAGTKDRITAQFDSRPLPLSEEATDHIAYSETFYPFSSFGWSPLRALQTRDLHFVEAPNPELYDLRIDPKEKQNRVAERTAAASVMKDKLAQMKPEPSLNQNQGTPRRALDSEAAEKLRALGYMAYRSSAAAAALKSELVDPKDKIDEFNAILAGTDAIKIGDFEKGETLLNAVLQKDPTMYLVPFMLGEAALRQRQWQRASDELEQCLKLNPEFDQAMTALARAYFQQERYEEARKWAQGAIDRNPQSFRAWYQMGWIAAKTSEDDAEKAFRKSISIQPNFALAHRDLGMIEFRRKNYAQAAQALKKAEGLGLGEPELPNFLGVCYSRMGRLKEAVAAYKRALRANPEYPEAHLNLGFAYQNLSRPRDAAREYKEACRLDKKLCELVPKAR